MCPSELSYKKAASIVIPSRSHGHPEPQAKDLTIYAENLFYPLKNIKYYDKLMAYHTTF